MLPDEIGDFATRSHNGTNLDPRSSATVPEEYIAICFVCIRVSIQFSDMFLAMVVSLTQ